MIESSEIRPIYEELQGYLSQTPQAQDTYKDVIYDRALWDRVNDAIDELKRITGSDMYDRWKIDPERARTSPSGLMVMLATFRSDLGGIINRLHAEYFSDEATPFSGTPSQVIEQTQVQEQAIDVRISMLLEVQAKIVEKLQDEQISPEERGFLEALKESIMGVKSATELVQLIAATAQSMGVSLASLVEMFS